MLVSALVLVAACSDQSPAPGNSPGASGSPGTAGTAGTSSGAGSSGASSSGGGSSAAGTGGAAGSPQSGASGSGGAAGSSAGSAGSAGAAGGGALDDFSFFVTSMAAMIDLSGNPEGFGGDLSYNGQAGVLGADEICKAIAERSMPGSGSKGWKAFLSTSTEDAIDRISGGPWFDRLGRLVANDKPGLLNERPEADPAIADDLPNEDGIPNHLAGKPTCESSNDCDDNHDTLTASNQEGRLDPMSGTCDDWTSLTAEEKPRIGHSWPAQSGQHWIMAHSAGGCGRSVHVDASGGPAPGDLTVGAGGGYGGFYCFASMR